MSGTVFGSRIRSSVSTFAFVALMATAPVLSAGAATVAPAVPATSAPAATTDSTATAPKLDQKVDQKAVTKSEAPKTEATKHETPKADAGKVDAGKTKHEQVAATPKVEVTKTQADAVAKELGAKPSEQLSAQLGKYHEQMLAAHALKDTAARDKAVAEARQQLAGIGGKPVTAEQAAKIDGILGLKTSTTIQ
ncbi:hypothetical protein TSH100_12710 [Azospirillum sp. TSH100]|uniref:hypothetical protein n=1 Tax=Azospirillum sp. TSH100 TaxID=652764 RepID=UPI000D61A781|nr:hypothetical protein [Azospirillum sp. TSH100]PWC86617.1 hypothetical protein TSH100_12710 [Azospirillum sp. TSH100]QCG86279.1 hypothetical protein E6C72_00135 [Azospirillum sp. TSH100]